MVDTLIKHCLKKGITLAVAESCTGGLLGAKIVDVSGVSQVFKGGVICYANAVKINLLGVSASIIEQEGAVSSACAEAMACGVRELLDADLAIAITGVAGPSGGTLKKPVGLVYLCVATRESLTVRDFQFQGTRSEIREQAAESAVEMMLNSL